MDGAPGLIVSVGTGVIPTTTVFDVAVPQPAGPVTTAWKYIAELTGQNTYGLVVAPAILVQVIPFGEDCHCSDPLNELRLSVTQPPWQTVLGATLAVPIVAEGPTVTCTVAGGTG